MKKLRNIAAFAFIAFFIASCAKPPLEEMNNAIAAVSRAENDSDVVNYAVNSLARAKDALSNMQTEADAKRYDTAKQLAEEAQRLAEKAITDGRSAADRAREDADTAIANLQSALTETEQTVTNAKRTNTKGVDFIEITKSLETAKTTTGEAVTAQSNKQYREALDKSQRARTTLSSITSTLSQRVIAESRKK